MLNVIVYFLTKCQGSYGDLGAIGKMIEAAAAATTTTTGHVSGEDGPS